MQRRVWVTQWCVLSSLIPDARVDTSEHQGKVQAHMLKENIFTPVTPRACVMLLCCCF